MIKAREENGITQKQLEAMSGIKQPVISRMENGTSDPQLSTVLKILNSFLNINSILSYSVYGIRINFILFMLENLFLIVHII